MTPGAAVTPGAAAPLWSSPASPSPSASSSVKSTGKGMQAIGIKTSPTSPWTGHWLPTPRGIRTMTTPRARAWTPSLCAGDTYAHV
eukprot:764581-Hanusia_phi.AAC.7